MRKLATHTCIMFGCFLLLEACSIPVMFVKTEDTGRRENLVAKHATPIVDKGDFTVGYETPTSKSLLPIAESLKRANVFEDLIGGLNADFALTKDLPTVFRECGEGGENMFYDPKEVQITICYEFVRQLNVEFSKVIHRRKVISEKATHALIFFFFHEVGHALCDIDKLPCGMGNAEEAADRFATFIMLQSEEASAAKGSREAAWDASIAFALISGNDSMDSDTLGDEHPLSMQRAYSVLCWLYGSDYTNNDLRSRAKEAGVPEERLEVCAREYEDLDISWSQLLEKHLKGDHSEK